MKGILKRLLRRSSIADSDRDEIESHIAMRAELNRQSGMSPEDADRSARRQFGNPASVRERLYDYNGFGWLETVFKDVVYAVRGLRRNVGVSLTAALTIAIGVSATTGMFGVIQNLMLAPPPHVDAPDRVFRLHQVLAEEGEEGEPSTRISYQFYEEISDNAERLEAVGAYRTLDLGAGIGPEARMTRTVMVSAGFWRALGVSAAAGRLILDAEAHPATGRRVVVLGHAFWQTRYGGQPDAVGQTIRIKGRPYEIVGVAPRGFRGVELADVDLWLPLFAVGDGSDRAVTWHTSGRFYNLKIVTRLQAGATLDEAEAEITVLQRAFLEETYGSLVQTADLERYRGARAILGPIAGALGDNLQPVPEARVTVWLAGAAAILIAIACSNVAGLMLLRAMRRRREIAVRLALGVSRARLARQLSIESSLLALLGGGAAALLTVAWSGAWLQQTILPAMTWDAAISIDRSVVAVAGISTLVCAFAAGMAPLYYSRSDALSSLHDRSLSGLARRPRMQGVLVATQGALSVVLLVGAGLFLRSLYNLETTDIGLERDQVLTVRIDFSGTGRAPSDIASFFERALERVRVLPGVTNASLGMRVPLRSAQPFSIMQPGSDEVLMADPYGPPFVNYVTPEYFQSTGMRIRAGREFIEADRAGEDSVVVNESLARLAWPGESPIGKCLSLTLGETCATVVGVVADVRSFSVIEEDEHASFYVPLTRDYTGPRTLLIRMVPGVRRMDVAIRQAIHEIDAGLPYINIETLGEALNPQIRPWRLGASVFTALGTLAMALALVGLWASVSYTVSQRKHEFAVRLAVGASRGVLIGLVLGDGVRNALIGISAGALIAAAASPLIADLLFGVSPRDPAVLAAVAGGVFVVTTAASLLPALRAARIHPIETLRSE